MHDHSVAAMAQDENLLRALWAGLMLAVATAPLGVFLILRRMSLIGDAFGHAILPGAAGAALLSGGATWAISLGAALTGTTVFVSASYIGRFLRLPEDAGLALFFMSALALGVVISAAGGPSLHLDELLFGDALGLDLTALILCAIAMVTSVAGMLAIYRPLMMDTLDGAFLASAGRSRSVGPLVQAVFFALLAITSVAAFHALGALMAVGMTIIPAIGARYLARTIPRMMLAAGCLAATGVCAGLIVATIAHTPAGASIILSLVAFTFLAAIFGPVGSVVARQGGYAHKPGSKVATSNT
jgi:zinc/manganese transport system permease protein